VFGHTEERRMERQLLADYRAWVLDLLPRMAEVELETAVALARLPEGIRGFGHVKQRSVLDAKLKQAELLSRLRLGAADPVSPVVA
jgi:indolepyruvate ferredoxin oxidoreductase